MMSPCVPKSRVNRGQGHNWVMFGGLHRETPANSIFKVDANRRQIVWRISPEPPLTRMVPRHLSGRPLLRRRHRLRCGQVSAGHSGL